MALNVNSNTSQILLNQLNKATQSSALHQQRIGSSKQINSAKDNAAGLSIINRMTSQITGLDQSVRNTSDGMSFLQTREGALSSVTSNVQRMRELSLQASNSILTSDDRKYIQAEFDAIKSEISQIVDTTTFNGTKVISDTSSLSFQVGPNSSEAISVNGFDLNATLTAQDFKNMNVLSLNDSSSAITKIDSMLNSINTEMANSGAVQNRFESTINNLEQRNIDLSATRSRIQDSDIAREASELAKADFQRQASIAMQAHANKDMQAVLGLFAKMM